VPFSANISIPGALIHKLKTDLPSYIGVAGVSLAPLPDNALNDNPVSTVYLLPWITIVEIDSKNIQTLSGSAGVGPTIVQFNVWGQDYEYASLARQKINTILEGFSGTISKTIDSFTASIVCQGGNHIGNHELYDGERKLYQLISRWTLYFEY
jgi:hypothetical protein